MIRVRKVTGTKIKAVYICPPQEQARPQAYIKLDRNSLEVFYCVEGFYIETMWDLTGV